MQENLFEWKGYRLLKYLKCFNEKVIIQVCKFYELPIRMRQLEAIENRYTALTLYVSLIFNLIIPFFFWSFMICIF